MGVLADRLGAGLALRRQQNLYRRRLTLDCAQGPIVQLGDRQYLNFCSNDYLGLAAHPRVVAAFQRAAADYGVGSGASHLVCGHSTLHQQLEEALAEFTGRPRVLLFSSGYMANTGILTSLFDRLGFRWLRWRRRLCFVVVTGHVSDNELARLLGLWYPWSG